MNGLYSPTASNKKRSEMEKREKIINNSDADLVVSIHMNSFPLSSCNGAQVFYKMGSEQSKSLADSIQKSFISDLPRARGTSSAGDYYVLNCTDKTAVLVECGYLSNEEDEKDLCDEEYRVKFCESLLRGILNYYTI
jgi:N-acetylmuramoyl-L-alanine amidase